MEKAVLFLDSYEKGLSLNDHEHLKCDKVCADVQLSESMEAYKNQEVFLANKKCDQICQSPPLMHIMTRTIFIVSGQLHQ